MKIVLITPSNINLMPYVKNYTDIIDKTNVSYTIINWDRLGNEVQTENRLTYKDNKNSFNRSFYDYIKYVNFVKKEVSRIKPDKIIVFGIQLTFFLKNFIKKNFKYNMVIDIRDYHVLKKFIDFNILINESKFTVISSPGYNNWLKSSNDNLIVNHNINDYRLEEFEYPDARKIIRLSYIGSLTNSHTNIALINKCINSNRINVEFHGRGIINKELEHYISRNDINNVLITGGYTQNEERYIYQQATIINMLLDGRNLNSRTCLSNRLYNAVKNNRPLLVFEGSYLAEVIKEFNLGLVLRTLDNIESEINCYFNEELNAEKFEIGRKEFLEKVKIENIIFERKLIEFIT